jgi:hypothetical protein
MSRNLFTSLPLYKVKDANGRIQKKHCVMCMGPYARVDYNLTSCPLQSRLQRIYHGRSNDRVDLNPDQESTLSLSQGLWIWPQEGIHG